MKRSLSIFYGLLLIELSSHATSVTTPWFTGPLLALPAQTVPLGHKQFQLFGFDFSSGAYYNNHSIVTSTVPNRSVQLMPTFIYGLAKDVDVEWDFIYVINHTANRTVETVGDVDVILGFQLFNQGVNDAKADLKLLIMEILPSGRYDYLKPANQGADATGMGSFQTQIGLNAQNLSHLGGNYYLNAFASVAYLYASSTFLHGLNAYGGDELTRGQIKPGNVFTFDLAAELSVTQHWVAVFEGYGEYQTRSHFTGDKGGVHSHLSAKAIDSVHHLLHTRHNLGMAGLGNDTRNAFSLAPAIEYNFSQTYGIIAGVWFTISGKNTPKFTAPAMGFNANW